MTQRAPFTYDIVGSFLRPERLKEARIAKKEGIIDGATLRKIEDEEIEKLIVKQKEVGLHAVTDGEFRRRWWHLDFIAGLNGIQVFDFTTTAFGITTEAQGTFVNGKLSFNPNHSFIEDFKFTNKIATREGVIAKQTIPGPNMIYLDSLILSKQYQENPIYETVEEFKKDLIQTYQDAIQAFYDAGCRYLQLDDTSWGGLFDERFRNMITEKGISPDDLIQEFGDITEAVLSNKPEDLIVTFHFCKGNFQSHFLYSGTYELISKRLFSITQIDGFFLEYDDERSGGFEPLQYIQSQKVVLGLITTKHGELEDVDTVVKRVQEASEVVPIQQLCISPQCGFASTQEGNTISEEQQWSKIRLLKEISEKAFGFK